jgi:GT2 family glycosyltransferase
MIPNLIVPVLNRYDLLAEMLASVDFPVQHLLIIDNGASVTEKPAEPLQVSDWFSEVTYLPMPSNLGVAASWNLGIKLLPHDSRWFIVSNDVKFDPGAVEQFSFAPMDRITLSASSPYWQAFMLPDTVVQGVGLFSEDLYPAYFEDTCYSWRMKQHNLPEPATVGGVHHSNSATVKSNPSFGRKNDRTFDRNRKRLRSRKDAGDLRAGVWDLSIRRANEWL